MIPKSTKPERMAQNINVFDFELSTDELAAIDGLETGTRGGPEPEVITMESFGRAIPEDRGHWGCVDAPDFPAFNADPASLPERVTNPMSSRGL